MTPPGSNDAGCCDEPEPLCKRHREILRRLRMSGEDSCGATKLWNAVIDQAIREANYTTRRSAKRQWMVARARAWIQSDSADFRLVCELAGRDPVGVLREIE